MKDHLAQARAHEAEARRWLDTVTLPPWTPRDGSRDAALMAYEAGRQRGDDERAIEANVGQRQIDHATELMRETAELLRDYEAHHRAQALIATRETVEFDRIAKAERNALAAARLEAWLAGASRFPIRYSDACRATDHPLRVIGRPDLEAAARGEASDESCRVELHDNVVDFETFPPVKRPPAPPNLKQVDGELGDPVVVESLMAASGMLDSTTLVRRHRSGGLVPVSLSTPDPRFDPARPVYVNGYLFRPAKED
jgi:hypothetical protein